MTPASAPAPKRQHAAGTLDGREALAIAHEHPDVGEQVVTEVDRLRALEVGIAGHGPIDMRLGTREQGLRERQERGASVARGLADERATSVAT